MAQNADLNVEIGLTVDRLARQLAQTEQRMVRAANRSERAFRQGNARAAASFRQIDVAANRTFLNMQAMAARTQTAMAGAFRGIGMGLAAPLIGGFSIEAFRRTVSSTVSEFSELAKAADRISLPVEELQGLQFGFEQAGISASTFTSAMERFGRRVGEAQNGVGPLQTTIERLGISLRDQDGQWRTQGDLLREFANQVQNAATEQQRLSIAQAAFGDAGRQMVTALQNGAAGLDDFIRLARDAGVVVDESLIRRAEELDDKFNQAFRRIERGFKSFIVEMVAGVDDFAQRLDEVLRGIDLVGGDRRAALGGAFARDLPTEELEDLLRIVNQLEIAALDASRNVAFFAEILDRAGQSDAADAFDRIAREVQELVEKSRQGQIEARDFMDELERLMSQATSTAMEIGNIDGISMDRIIGVIGSLAGALAAAREQARGLWSELTQRAAAATGPTDAQVFRDAEMRSREAHRQWQANQDAFMRGEAERNAKTQERLDLEREVGRVLRDANEEGATFTKMQAEAIAQARIDAEALRREAAAAARGAGGRSGGGGRSGRDDAARELERELEARQRLLDTMDEQVARLEFEISMVGRSTEEVARARAEFELLNQAKRAGIDVDTAMTATGESLRQVIEGQAAAVGRLTAELDLAREKSQLWESIQNQLVDGFINAIARGEDFRQTLANIAAQLAKLALQAALFGTGPLAGLFGGTPGRGLLTGGFAEGGYTGAGGKYQPAGIVHKGEYVFSQDAVRRIGTANLERMHRNLRGYADGGLVGSAAPAAPTVNISPSQAQVVIIDDPDRIGEYLASARGERQVVQVMRRNGVGSGG